jgi:16S rRNA G966 N2-methylase RsmD
LTVALPPPPPPPPPPPRSAATAALAVATVLAAGAPAPMDLVFADPPYEVAADEVNQVLADLDRHGWVDAGSVVVIERPFSSPARTWPQGWAVWPLRRYGDTRVDGAEVGGDC